MRLDADRIERDIVPVLPSIHSLNTFNTSEPVLTTKNCNTKMHRRAFLLLLLLFPLSTIAAPTPKSGEGDKSVKKEIPPKEHVDSNIQQPEDEHRTAEDIERLVETARIESEGGQRIQAAIEESSEIEKAIKEAKPTGSIGEHTPATPPPLDENHPKQNSSQHRRPSIHLKETLIQW